MCRLTAYFGNSTLAADIVTRPARSVIRQSFDARERLGGSGNQVYDIGNLNADGFGLGWYDEDGEDVTPCVFTDVGPAWHNRNLHRLARKIRSPIIFAHVRAAGPGMDISQNSCHPFEFGRYLFMHNGLIAGFQQIRRKLLSRLSQCAFDFAIAHSASDSAVSFAVFVDLLEDPMANIPVSELCRKLVQTMEIICAAGDEANIKETSLLNFVVSDGKSLAATRYVRNPEGCCGRAASLYFSSGTRFEAVAVRQDEMGGRGACSGSKEDSMDSLMPKEEALSKAGGKKEKRCGQSDTEEVRAYRMVHDDKRDEVVIITSEPLTDMRADWTPVPVNHIIAVTPQKQVLLAPIVILGCAPCVAAGEAAEDLAAVFRAFGHDAACTSALVEPQRESVDPPRLRLATANAHRAAAVGGGAPETEEADDSDGERSSVLGSREKDSYYLPSPSADMRRDGFRRASAADMGESELCGLDSDSALPTRLRSSTSATPRLQSTGSTSPRLRATGKRAGREEEGRMGFAEHLHQINRLELLRGYGEDKQACGCAPASRGPDPLAKELRSLHPPPPAAARPPPNTRRVKDSRQPPPGVSMLPLPPVTHAARPVGDSEAVPEPQGEAPGAAAPPPLVVRRGSVMEGVGGGVTAGWRRVQPEHILTARHSDPILAIALRGSHIFAADSGECGCIAVYNTIDFSCLRRTPPQHGNILALCIALCPLMPNQPPSDAGGDAAAGGAGAEREVLVCSCSNNWMSVWDVSEVAAGMPCLAQICCPNMGHILSLAVGDPAPGWEGGGAGGERQLVLGSQDGRVRCVPLRELTNGAVDTRADGRQTLLALIDLPDDLDSALTPRSSSALPPTAAGERRGRRVQRCRVEAKAGRELRNWKEAVLAKDALRTAASHCGYVYALVCSGDALCTAGGDGSVKVWSLATGALRRKLVGHRAGVMALAADAEWGGTVFSGSRDGSVRVWEAELGVCRRTLDLACDVLCLALTPDLLLIGTHDGSVAAVSRRNLAAVRLLAASKPVHCMSVDAGQGLVVGGTVGEAIMWTLPPPLDSNHSPPPGTGPGEDRDPAAAAALAAGGGTASPTRRRGEAHVPVLEEIQAAVRRKRARLALEPPPPPALTPAAPSNGAEATDGPERAAAGPGPVGGSGGAGAGGERWGDERLLVQVLKELVSLRTVSADPRMAEECWRGGRFVAAVLQRFGCHVQLKTHRHRPGMPPVVLARMPANAPQEGAAGTGADGGCVVVYGHYDVAGVVTSQWATDPFELAARDGFLYGRGVSDDKGPVCAAIFAAHALHARGALPLDVVFVIEGEEECGESLGERGLREVLEENREWFAGCRGVVISNNYWVDDASPCLTYGMRGVIDLEVWVAGPERDLHSGMDGGAVQEPMADLTALLASLLHPDGRIAIPGAADGVRGITPEERARLAAVGLDPAAYFRSVGARPAGPAGRFESGAEVLAARWVEPSLSISAVESTNAAHVFRKIPRVAVARVSLHFVPEQDSGALRRAVEEHLRREFGMRGGGNRLEVVVKQVSEWWLGDTRLGLYRMAADAIRHVWGVDPILVREGGSYGGITRMLEETLHAPAVHIPLGQASDGAHLANERIRVHNLRQGCLVLQHLLSLIAAAPPSPPSTA